MENVNEIKSNIRLVIDEIYQTKKTSVWYTSKEMAFANLFDQVGLDERYARVLKDVLTKSKINGESLMIFRGHGKGVQYRLNSCKMDTDVLVDKIIKLVTKKGDSESYYKPSKKGDCIPMIPKSDDRAMKLEKKQAKKSGTIRTKMTRVLNLNEKCYIELQCKIHECRVNGMRLDLVNSGKKELTYQLEYSTSGDIDMKRSIWIPFNKVYSCVTDLVNAKIAELKSNIIKY